jgi:hypothetical protein
MCVADGSWLVCSPVRRKASWSKPREHRFCGLNPNSGSGNAAASYYNAGGYGRYDQSQTQALGQDIKAKIPKTVGRIASGIMRSAAAGNS